MSLVCDLLRSVRKLERVVRLFKIACRRPHDSLSSDIRHLLFSLFRLALSLSLSLSVSLALGHIPEAIVMVQMIAIRALPERDGSRMRVSLLSRYGMWPLRKEIRRQKGDQRIT